MNDNTTLPDTTVNHLHTLVTLLSTVVAMGGRAAMRKRGGGTP